MADDRISINLVLNEATVSAVEGRVRNLVNRLNNQNISLNINGRNLDNIINRLNIIQQQMQRLNNSTININANLTSAQQQYRLETERLRVSQQLELSRQRTLQTENQALMAMYNQNRTLNINNNVTHQIEQGVQNVGNNMQVAGIYANDFVTYLANGVRYLAAYRTLEVVMNNMRDAFEEMKNVDKAVISVKKTTGMSDNEVENIRQSSYGVATEYGRTASEYLESVSEFARAGYKEQSTELGKISLLTQNVGDVSAESADKMLLAVDAAYKLKGNVTELTDVVNGLNNIANLNPTSMQKMADGIQVSASMAQVAGLEISDLVALVGTGTAVTQREGSEIARAIRTIIMNIRQVKGELDDGTVIDDDSIAKAEKALEGVGIATKEVVNGVRELRDPMKILDELAGKWSNLNTEAQSVVLESLANKRQANVLAAILENYELVGKMQSEYFNSANSAIKENELYLQGWEATSNRVSAKWTEYIANMADTSLITGSLNALYGVLVALDTPIGRIATQVVLVNTALAVTGRLWTAIRARSVVADILALGVAERNLGDAIQLVTGHLGRQALAFATSPLGMATIVVTGITLITSAIEKNSQKLEENAQKAGEALEKSKSDLDKLDTLIKKYNDLQLTNEWDNATVEDKKQLHEEINQLLGDEADKVDILNGKYKETTEELFKQRMAKLPEEEKTAFDNEQAKGKTLWDKVYWNNGISTAYTSVLSYEEEEFLNKYAHIFDSDHATVNGESVHNYQLSFDNFQDFLYKYDEAKKMLQNMYNEGLGESELYKDFNEYVAQFDTKVTEYRTAVDELEKTKAGQKLAEYINQNVGGYIDNLEEYNQVVEWIEENLSGSSKDNAIGFLNSYFSEYADKVNAVAGGTSTITSALETEIETLSALQDKLDILQSVQEEYNNAGAITAETMQKMIDNDLLQYLDFSSGKLRINTEALLAEGEAAKINAIQKLQDAMATDLMNLATGKTEELSNTAKTAITNLGNSAEVTGSQAETAAAKLAGFAIAAQAAKDGAEGKLSGMSVEDFNIQADAIISAYTSAANSIGNVTIKSPTKSSGSSSKKNSGSSSKKNSGSSSSSSSDKNEALDNYLKYAERLYKTHQNETKYINDLEWALNNLVKTEEERLEILDDIEQARKDYADNRIKDIEHEIEMAQKLDENADVRDYYRQIQQIAHEEAERLRSIGYDNNSNEVQEMQKIWWNAENSIVDVTESIGESIVEMADRAGDAFEATVKRIEKNIDAVDHKLELLYATDRTPNIEAEGNLYTEKITNQQDLVDSYRHNQEMAHVNANDTRRQFSDVVDYFGNDTIDRWFDADGEVIEDLLNDSLADITDSVFKERIRTFAETLSIHKQDWHSSYDGEQQAIEDLYATRKEYEDKLMDYEQQAHDAIVEMINDRKEKELEAIEEIHEKATELLEERREIIEDTYSRQLELMKDIKDEENYQRELNEETDKLNQIQQEIDKYSLIDTNAARTKVSELQKQLQEQQDVIAEKQRQKEYDDKVKALEEDRDLMLDSLDQKVEDENDAYDKIKEAIEERYTEEKVNAEATEALLTGKLKVFTEKTITSYDQIGTEATLVIKNTQTAWEDFYVSSGTALDNLHENELSTIIGDYDTIID